MSKLTQFFKATDGGIPKILYALPILVILIGGLFYLSMNIKTGVVKQKIKAASMAVGLQDDINFISTKTKASEVFDLSKKEMIKAEKNENFLMARVKRKLDKSVFSESMGVNDETLAGFDDDLSPTLSDNPESMIGVSNGNSDGRANIQVDSIQATDDLNYLMNKIKEDKKSKYHILEEQRKQRLAAAKLENKRKREALDRSTLSAEATAYQKGLADSQAQYAAFHGTNTETAAKKKKAKKNALAFSTSIGLKDDLSLNVKKVPITNTENLAPIDPFEHQASALKAVIDQKQKFRTGDKIQLRVLEMGFYKDYIIPKNTLLYGICSINSNRLYVNISSITLNGKVMPSSLSVYDLDGIPGIYIDGAYQDATKQAINQGLADAGNIGLRNTLGNLSIRLGRKANQKQTASIPGGYEVLIFDANNL